ncbi:shikimate kinase [Chengkuizengella axinellae]|uniref:Shikimate kinase n=1 Tax=Chengkuizengella axinellae TaxID=3064388 RepID=A0ABT9IVC3_9BACL|nr:shikimate kinase [Chengkuizengella sp. 2205SS18-9]MDP5273308.1 shikimate kinase [Chengkuizengella sp. 2205SS18-9]
MKKNNIVLVGFMGTGKSTVGKKLSSKLGWGFVDTDDWIEKREHLSIPEIFSTKGEVYFRKVEAEVIQEVMASEHQVIATGGGAVLSLHNRSRMLSQGTVIQLKADADTIIKRVEKDTHRPLLQGNIKDKVYEIMEKRKYAYEFADIILDTSAGSVDHLVEQIYARIYIK